MKKVKKQLFLLNCMVILVGNWLIADQRQDSLTASHTVLEVYLNRADASQEQKDWEHYAGDGLSTALAAWERSASVWLSHDPAAESSRADAVENLKNEVSKRFAAWYLQHFFDTQKSLATIPFWQKLDNFTRTCLFETDFNGNILFDKANDPLTKTTTGFDADKASWETNVSISLQEIISVWDQNWALALPELTLQVPEGFKASFTQLASQIAAQRRQSYSQELSTMVEQSRQRLVSSRLFDQYSLAKKAEDAAAEALVSGLLKDVRTQSNQSIEDLRRNFGLDATNPELATTVAPESWQASFKSNLEAGLAQWGKAEEYLLAQRIDWEQQAYGTQAAIEPAWADAYTIVQVHIANSQLVAPSI